MFKNRRRDKGPPFLVCLQGRQHQGMSRKQGGIFTTSGTGVQGMTDTRRPDPETSETWRRLRRGTTCGLCHPPGLVRLTGNFPVGTCMSFRNTRPHTVIGDDHFSFSTKFGRPSRWALCLVIFATPFSFDCFCGTLGSTVVFGDLFVFCFIVAQTP